MAQQACEDRTEYSLRSLVGSFRQSPRQGEEPAMSVSRVLRPVRMEDQGFAGEEISAVHGRQFGRERERPERREGVRSGQRVDPSATQQVRPRVAAVQCAYVAVPADLQKQYGDELLGDRVVVPGPLTQVSAQRALQPAQHTAEFGLVMDGLAEAAEDRGDGTESGEAMPTDVPHDDTHTVLGGDDLVQVTADRGTAVRGELGGGDVQPLDARRERSQQGTLRGAGDLPDLPEFAQQGMPDVKYQPGADNEEHGTGREACLEAVLLSERTGQLVGDGHGTPRHG